MISDGVFRRKFLGVLGSVPLIPLPSISQFSLEETTPYVESEDDVVYIGNSHFELEIVRHNGGIKQLVLKRPEIELLSNDPLPQELWEIGFYTEEYTRLTSSSWRSDPPSITTRNQGDTAIIELEWENPTLHTRQSRLDSHFKGEVHATISVSSGDKEAEWNIEVVNEGDRAVKQVLSPKINNIKPLSDDGSDALYIPLRLGRKITNPTENESLPNVPYPSGFGTMQFVTYTDGQYGVYATAKDSDGHAKRLEFNASEDDTLRFEATHLVPHRQGKNVEVPYNMGFGVHYGGWQDACDRYRNWVTTEGWLSDSSPSVPEHLRERGVSFHGRCYLRSEVADYEDGLSFEQMQQAVSNLQSRLDAPIDFRWWGWEKYGRPAGGDWLPPKEGHDKFENVINGLNEEDINTTGYLNPTLAFDGSDYWTDLDYSEQYPATNRDGSPRKMTDDHTEMTFFHMEPTYPEWRGHYQPVLEDLVDAGTKEIDLDGWPWKWVPNCWNEAHDHPNGIGGNWYPQRMRELLRDLHNTLSVDDQLAIGGEGIADFYLPYLNVHVIRDAGVELMDPHPMDLDIVPMFPYTFGDYAETKSLRGHIGTFTDQRNIQRLIAGRSIEWGSLPMFMGRYEPLPGDYDDAVLDYYSRIGRARSYYANRFLARGKMLDQPNIDRETTTINQRDVAIETNEIKGRWWRSSENELGLVLTNVSNRENSRVLELDISEQPYDLPSDPTIYTVQNGEYKTVRNMQVTIEIDPSDVILLAVIPPADNAEEALSHIERAQASENVDDDLLEDAKRALDGANYNKAIEKSREAVERKEDEQDGETETEQRNEQDGETETDEDIPGFGIGGALTAIGGTVYWVKHRILSDDEC